MNLGHNSGSKPLIEDLGTDTIQGVEAHGRRITTTIPAGEIGNAAPLVRTRETWMAVAPTLQGLVVRENSDDPAIRQDDKGTRQPRSAGARRGLIPATFRLRDHPYGQVTTCLLD